jgi:hypothetical protein
LSWLLKGTKDQEECRWSEPGTSDS